MHVDIPAESTPQIAAEKISDVTSLGKAKLRFSPLIRTKKIKHTIAIIIPAYAIIVYKES